MPKLDYDVTKPPVMFKEAEKRTPDRFGNLLILLGGVAAASIMGFIFFSMIMSENPASQGTGILGILGIIVTFYKILSDSESVQTVETIIGHDLDRDGYIGAPQITEVSFAASERTTWMSKLPASPALILEWGEAALDGRSLGYDRWARRFALQPSGSDGRARYAAFRDALVRDQLAIQQGTHGISLTDRGIQQFTEYVYQRPKGTPLLDG